MIKDIITYEITDNYYKIFINDILHLCLIKTDYNVISWIEDSNPEKRMYIIQIFIMKNFEIKLEYEKEDNWVDVLNCLNEVL